MTLSPLVLFFGRGGRTPLRIRGATPTTVVESFGGTATALVRCPCDCDGIVGGLRPFAIIYGVSCVASSSIGSSKESF